jgi:hypothetical protein
MESVSRVFDHVSGQCKPGFKLLLLAFFDGVSTTGCDFTLHREKGKNRDYGLSAQLRKKQYHKRRANQTHGQPLTLFFICYVRQSRRHLLLTTDTRLNFTQAFELYQIRWNIEVLFKETKKTMSLPQRWNVCLSQWNTITNTIHK